MREARRRAEGGWLGGRHAAAGARAGQALHLVELSLARLGSGRQGPPARSHLARARARRSPRRHAGVQASARLATALGPRAGDGDARPVGALLLKHDPENRYPPRIKSGACFFGIMLYRRPHEGGGSWASRTERRLEISRVD